MGRQDQQRLSDATFLAFTETTGLFRIMHRLREVGAVCFDWMVRSWRASTRALLLKLPFPWTFSTAPLTPSTSQSGCIPPGSIRPSNAWQASSTVHGQTAPYRSCGSVYHP
jgi:hypothetical protein